MSFSFRPARRSEAKPLIGLYSESGRGKTMSALLLARGFVGPEGKIGMIETEAGRGEAYADLIPGGYSVLSIRDQFSPANYGEAITAAEKAGMDALIIDSASHEWEGSGGVLAQAAENQAAGKKGPLVWQQPKISHQRNFMLRLMQTPIPLVIVCMRAKFPMIERKKPNGEKEWVRSETLEPKQADDILFEMFVHGWIDEQHRFRGTKYTRPDLKDVIKDGEPISIETGRALAEWAKGGKPTERPAAAQSTPASQPGGGSDVGQSQAVSGEAGNTSPASGLAALSDDEAAVLEDMRQTAKNGWEDLKKKYSPLHDDYKRMLTPYLEELKSAARYVDEMRKIRGG